jgi:hypothetical protein
VSDGAIPHGTEVIIEMPYLQQLRLAKVVGYIAHTDAYLCDIGREVKAVPAKDVMRRVPKFNSVEEADAWLEGR